MTPAQAQPGRRVPSAAEVCAPGLVLAGAVWALLFATRALAEGQLWFAAAGIVLAALVAWIAGAIHVGLLRSPAGGTGVAGAGATSRIAGAHVTRALALGFLAKVLGLVGGAGVLVLTGVKFEFVAAFAIAFAAASLLIQVGVALMWNRAVVRGDANRAAAGQTGAGSTGTGSTGAGASAADAAAPGSPAARSSHSPTTSDSSRSTSPDGPMGSASVGRSR